MSPMDLVAPTDYFFIVGGFMFGMAAMGFYSSYILPEPPNTLVLTLSSLGLLCIGLALAFSLEPGITIEATVLLLIGSLFSLARWVQWVVRRLRTVQPSQA